MAGCISRRAVRGGGGRKGWRSWKLGVFGHGGGVAFFSPFSGGGEVVDIWCEKRRASVPQGMGEKQARSSESA